MYCECSIPLLSIGCSLRNWLRSFSSLEYISSKPMPVVSDAIELELKSGGDGGTGAGTGTLPW